MLAYYVMQKIHTHTSLLRHKIFNFFFFVTCSKILTIQNIKFVIKIVAPDQNASNQFYHLKGIIHALLSSLTRGRENESCVHHILVPITFFGFFVNGVGSSPIHVGVEDSPKC